MKDDESVSRGQVNQFKLFEEKRENQSQSDYFKRFWVQGRNQYQDIFHNKPTGK